MPKSSVSTKKSIKIIFLVWETIEAYKFEPNSEPKRNIQYEVV